MAKQLTELNSTMRPASSIGESILPSSDTTILRPLSGLHGVLQVRPIPEADTYGLFFAYNDGTSCIAQHSNGYSCHNLAVRLIEVWAGKREPAYALAQFDYIIACGGLGKARESIAHIAEGLSEAPKGHVQKPSEIAGREEESEPNLEARKMSSKEVQTQTYTADEAMCAMYVLWGAEAARSADKSNHYETNWDGGGHMGMAQECLRAARLAEAVWDAYEGKDDFGGVWLYEVAEELGAWLYAECDSATDDAIKAKVSKLIAATADLDKAQYKVMVSVKVSPTPESDDFFSFGIT